MATPILIDCDPGIDDCVALLVALGSPELDLLGVTTVAGNAPIEQTTRNALDVLALAGAERIEVAAGAERPLVRPDLSRQPAVHGEAGIGGVQLPPSPRAARDGHAVALIADAVRARPGEVVLVALGPLTNVALFAALHPDLCADLAEIVIMGGAQRAGGNITPAGEFNVWFDPEAAARVLQAPCPLRMVGLDVTHEVTLGAAEIGTIAQVPVIGGPIAAMLEHYVDRHRAWYDHDHVYVHDALAVLAVADPGVVGSAPRAVEVDTGWGPGRGATLVDRWGSTGAPPTVAWATDVDAVRARDGILRRLAASATG